jgi:hypothetical protein
MIGLTPNLRGLKNLDPALNKVLEDMLRALREVGGIGIDKDSLDRYIQRKDLVQWGFATQGDGGLSPSESNQFDSTPPDAPTNLVVLGGYAQIILKWEASVDSRRGYFEVWRNTVDNLGTAAKIGQTTAWTLGDSVQNNQTQYYWLRAVSRFSDTIVSPWASTAGTPATTAPDIGYSLSVLRGAQGDQPFYNQPTDITVGGVLIPAGTYVKSLYAYAATVALFRAGLAVIDDANIISLNAVKITTGTMSADRIDTNTLVAKMGTFTTGQFGTIFAGKAFLTSAMINDSLQSDNFNGNPATNDPGTLGWYIGRSGKLYATGGVFSGQINASTFVGGSFSGGSFSGGVFTGTNLIAGYIRSSIPMATYTTPPGSLLPSVSGFTFEHDLAANGTQLAMHINGRFRVYANGRVEIDDVLISRANVLARGTKNGTPLARWSSTGGGYNPEFGGDP